MNCPNDKTEMEKGVCSGQLWSKGEPSRLTTILIIGTVVVAYRCPKCGKVELMTEVEEKKEEK